MTRFSFTAASVCLLVASSAHALSNAGFETGDATGWSPTINATLEAKTSYDVHLIDDAVGGGSFYDVTINPVSGNYFGLLTVGAPPATNSGNPQSSASYTFNLSGLNSSNGDIVWLRFITADYLYGAGGYNDSVSLSYNGNPLDSIDAVALGVANSPDSGWKGYALPTGTQNLAVTVTNFYDSFGSNTPLVALDFTAAAVPEPGMAALSLAGLAVIGAMARRRRVEETKSQTA